MAASGTNSGVILLYGHKDVHIGCAHWRHGGERGMKIRNLLSRDQLEVNWNIRMIFCFPKTRLSKQCFQMDFKVLKIL